MKPTHLLAAIVAAALPFAIVSAEDTTKPDATDQKSNKMEMMDMNKGQMMSSLKDQDAELDKLVTEMNSAPADKKVDAIAAVLTKLVEQRKTMHEKMQAMMAANMKDQMNMCRMMMGMMGMKMDGDQGSQGNTDHTKHQ